MNNDTLPVLASAAYGMTMKHEYQQSNCNRSRSGISFDCDPAADQ